MLSFTNIQLNLNKMKAIFKQNQTICFKILSNKAHTNGRYQNYNLTTQRNFEMAPNHITTHLNVCHIGFQQNRNMFTLYCTCGTNKE
jgi:hypothetical protein